MILPEHKQALLAALDSLRRDNCRHTGNPCGKASCDCCHTISTGTDAGAKTETNQAGNPGRK
jgi:hypothetical protein